MFELPPSAQCPAFDDWGNVAELQRYLDALKVEREQLLQIHRNANCFMSSSKPGGRSTTYLRLVSHKGKTSPNSKARQPVSKLDEQQIRVYVEAERRLMFVERMISVWTENLQRLTNVER